MTTMRNLIFLGFGSSDIRGSGKKNETTVLTASEAQKTVPAGSNAAQGIDGNNADATVSKDARMSKAFVLDKLLRKSSVRAPVTIGDCLRNPMNYRQFVQYESDSEAVFVTHEVRFKTKHVRFVGLKKKSTNHRNTLFCRIFCPYCRLPFESVLSVNTHMGQMHDI